MSQIRPQRGHLTFRHAGDRGDIIYSLPVIKHSGGGVLYIEAAGYTRERLTPDRWASLKSLLLSQSYITELREYSGGRTNVNLNDFRAQMAREVKLKCFNPRKSLAQRMCEAHGVPVATLNQPWLEIAGLVGVADVVFARSGRYHGKSFPWGPAYDQYGARAIFIGIQEEHKAFCKEIGHVPWYPTDDFMEVARVIAGALLFVGNQSCPYAIAEGLKQNAILEVWHDGPNCLFPRSNSWQFWDASGALPDLNALLRCVGAPTENPFTEEYFLKGNDLGISNYTDYKWLPDVTTPLAEAIVKHLRIQRDETLCDFGCARGYLVKALQALGVKAVGYDTSRWAIENRDPELNSSVSAKFPEQEFDWAIAKDVLEHIPMPDLEITLRRLVPLVRKGLFITVALCDRNGTRYIRPEDNKDTTHVVRWDLPTWMKLISGIDPSLNVSGSYRLPGICDHSEQWPGCLGLITALR